VTLDLFIPIEPRPKQAMKIGVNKHTGRAMAFGDADLKKYVKTIRVLAGIEIRKQIKGFKPWTGPVYVNVLEFKFTPPESHLKGRKGAGAAARLDRGEDILKYTKPDLDNLIKPLFDALNGVAFEDDGQVCSISCLLKVYSRKPGIHIKLSVDDFQDDQLILTEIGET